MATMVGVIGCGNIARFHFEGLEAAGARVAWVCDTRPEAAAPWAERFGARAETDWRAVMADDAVRAVWLATPSRLHREMALAAFAAGKAVVCEKTLGADAEDSLAIARAARASGAYLATSYMKRFLPAVVQMKALLPSLGKLLSAHFRAHQCWGDLWSSAPAEGFFHTPPGGPSPLRQAYGGGILVCGGSHLLDLALHLLGRPTRVAARVAEPDGRDYDLHALMLLDTPACPATVEALAHPLDRIGFLRDGWDEQAEITGTRGRLRLYSAAWDQPHAKACLLRHYDNETGDEREYRFRPASPFVGAVRHFLDAIERGAPSSPGPMEGYWVDELIAHALASARKNESLPVVYRD